jgi:hypothetical protein
VFCPTLPKFPEADSGRREVDLIGFGGSNEAQSGVRQQAAGREQLRTIRKKMGQHHGHGLPPVNPRREERRSTCSRYHAGIPEPLPSHA